MSEFIGYYSVFILYRICRANYLFAFYFTCDNSFSSSFFLAKKLILMRSLWKINSKKINLLFHHQHFVVAVDFRKISHHDDINVDVRFISLIGSRRRLLKKQK